VSIRLVVLLLHAVADVLRSARGASPPPADEEADDNSFAESVFLAEIAERANDRLLADIRAFNAAAIVLLGPILAVVALVDYNDVRNFIPAGFAIIAALAAMRTVLSGDGKPSPLLGADFFEAFSADAEDARKNIIADIALAGPKNRRLASMKSRWLRFAGYVTFVSIIVAVGLKVVESLTRAH
jgi:hypothetical protein